MNEGKIVMKTTFITKQIQSINKFKIKKTQITKHNILSYLICFQSYLNVQYSQYANKHIHNKKM